MCKDIAGTLVSFLRMAGFEAYPAMTMAGSREMCIRDRFTAAAQRGRSVRILHPLTQPGDHPVNIDHPEGEYLKGLVLYVDVYNRQVWNQTVYHVHRQVGDDLIHNGVFIFNTGNWFVVNEVAYIFIHVCTVFHFIAANCQVGPYHELQRWLQQN